MSRYTFKITTEGSQKEAEDKAKAIQVLVKKLTAEELLAFARVVKNQPEKIKMAKAYLGI